MRNKKCTVLLTGYIIVNFGLSVLCMNSSVVFSTKITVVLSMCAITLSALSTYLISKLARKGYLNGAFRFLAWLLLLIPFYIVLCNVILSFVYQQPLRIVAMFVSTLFAALALALLDTRRFVDEMTLSVMMKWTSICFIMISALLLIAETIKLLSE